MSKFIEYYGSAHLNSMNVAAYESAEGVKLVAENVANGKELGERLFDSEEAAEDWFSGLEGSNNVSRLASALEALQN